MPATDTGAARVSVQVPADPVAALNCAVEPSTQSLPAQAPAACQLALAVLFQVRTSARTTGQKPAAIPIPATAAVSTAVLRDFRMVPLRFRVRDVPEILPDR